jgi:outer membrane protein
MKKNVSSSVVENRPDDVLDYARTDTNKLIFSKLINNVKFLLLLLFTFPTLAQRLSVDECIAYALKKHPTVQNTKSTIQIRNEEYAIARKEALPSVSGSMSQGGSLGRNIDPFSNSFVTNAINFNSTSLSSSFTIFNGFRQRYERATRELATKGAMYDNQILEWNAKREVTESFYAYILSLEAVKLKRQQLLDIEKQLTGLSELVKEGQLPRTTYDEQLIQQLLEESNLLQLQNDIKNSLLNLASSIYWNKSDSLRIDTTLSKSGYNIGRLNLQRQPVFLKAINDVSISRYNGELNLIRFKPTLAFNANIGTAYSSAAPDEFTFFRQLNTNFGQYAGVSLSVPIYNKGQRKNVATVNRLSNIIAERNKDLALFELEQQTKRTVNDLQLADNGIVQLNKQIEISKRVYAATSEKYKEGIINTLELPQRQTSFYQTVLSLKVEEINRNLLLRILELYR